MSRGKGGTVLSVPATTQPLQLLLQTGNLAAQAGILENNNRDFSIFDTIIIILEHTSALS